MTNICPSLGLLGENPIIWFRDKSKKGPEAGPRGALSIYDSRSTTLENFLLFNLLPVLNLPIIEAPGIRDMLVEAFPSRLQGRDRGPLSISSGYRGDKGAGKR